MVVLSVIVIGVAGQQALLKVLFFPLYPIASNKKVVIAKYYVVVFLIYTSLVQTYTRTVLGSSLLLCIRLE